MLTAAGQLLDPLRHEHVKHRGCDLAGVEQVGPAVAQTLDHGFGEGAVLPVVTLERHFLAFRGGKYHHTVLSRDEVVDHSVDIDRSAPQRGVRHRLPGVAGIEEQHRLAGEIAQRPPDVVLRHAAQAHAVRRRVRRQKPVGVLLVGPAVTGQKHHADIAAGDFVLQPLQTLNDRIARRFVVAQQTHGDVAVKEAALRFERRRKVGRILRRIA